MKLVTKELYLGTFKNLKLGELSFLKYKHLFPVRPSERLAQIVADLSCDGHLGRGLIQYISKEKYEVIRFKSLVKTLFMIEGRIRRGPSNKSVWEYICGRNILAKILKMCGVPQGEKVLIKFEVPEWIKFGNRSIQKNYLMRLYDCEGSVSLWDNRKVRIKFKMHKSLKLIKDLETFLNDIREMLMKFGIKTTNLTNSGFTKRKDGIITKGLDFEIQGSRHNLVSIINFQKNINFSNRTKRKRLTKYIKLLSSTKRPRKFLGKAQLG